MGRIVSYTAKNDKITRDDLDLFAVDRVAAIVFAWADIGLG